jgi:hypothetical protein
MHKHESNDETFDLKYIRGWTSIGLLSIAVLIALLSDHLLFDAARKESIEIQLIPFKSLDSLPESRGRSLCLNTAIEIMIMIGWCRKGLF